MQPSFEDQPTPDATHGLPISKPALHRHHRTKGDDPAMPKSSLRGKPRAQFLLDIPTHEYLLPGGGPINATIIDLIVLLPQWFRNPGIAWRFLNNGVNSAVHFAILEQHRHLSLTNVEEAERARDHISDTYRKTMRKIRPGWTKAKHEIPGDWNELATSITNYVPEAASKTGYITPPSIPFKDLAVGLKKLPRGYDAGDLTRALDFAMQNQKLDKHDQPTEFMFPDDIQLILNHIGPTHITQGHVDGAVLGRYFQVLRAADGARRKQISEQRRQQQTTDEATAKSVDLSHLHQMPPYQGYIEGRGIYQSPFEDMSRTSPAQLQMQPTADFAISSRGYDGMPPIGMGVLMPTALHDPPMTQRPFREVPQGLSHNESQDLGYGGISTTEPGYSSPITPYLTRSNSQGAAAIVASKLVSQGAQQAYVDFPDIPDICKFEGDDQRTPSFLENWSHLDPQRVTEDMDALMAAHQTYDLNGLPRPVPCSSQARYLYHPSTLLRDCSEGLDANDHSDLARASRWARQWGYFSNDFKVEDIDLVLSAMNIPEATVEPGGH